MIPACLDYDRNLLYEKLVGKTKNTLTNLTIEPTKKPGEEEKETN